MYIKNKDNDDSDDEEIVLSSLDATMLVREGLRRPLEEILRDAEKSGRLPNSPFKEIAIDRIENDHAAMSEALTAAGIAPSSFFEITFSKTQESAEQQENGDWLLPAPILYCQGRRVIVTGTLPLVTPQGLLAFVNDNEAEIFKAFPEFLLLSFAVKEFSLPIAPQLIAIKKGKWGVRTLADENPLSHLKHYVDYYFEGLLRPLPVLPEWIPELLKQEEAFTKKAEGQINNSFQPHFDQYLAWAVPTADHLDAALVHKQWKGPVGLALGPHHESWFPKKEKGASA